jgi:hypothetical protein
MLSCYISWCAKTQCIPKNLLLAVPLLVMPLLLAVSLQAVPPKLSLSSEGLSAYMASLQEKRRQLEERRKQAESKKQVGGGAGTTLVGRMAGLATYAPRIGLRQHTRKLMATGMMA